MKRSGQAQLTLAEFLGHGRRGQARKRLRDEREVHATAKAPSEPQLPSMPDLDMLSIGDRQRVCAALGVEMPVPVGMPELRAPDVTVSRKLADRYVEDMARRKVHEQSKRADELRPGAFRGEIASAADVRRRACDLGLDPHALQYLSEPSRPLAPPADRDADRAVVTQADNDREVARRVHRAMQTGQRIDARKLSPGEVRALLEIRGAA